MSRLFKPFLFLALLVVALFNSPLGLAASGYSATCSNYQSRLSNEPEPADVLCVLVRVFNIVLLMVGVVLVGLIIYGAIKLNMSLGDPKGLAGAQQHWTWLVVGFFVVVGFFAIYLMIVSVIGVGSGFTSPMSILDLLFLRFSALLQGAGITSGP